jgi:signal transduction histidine kinase
MSRVWLRATAVAVAVLSNVGGQVVSAITKDYADREHGIGWFITFIVVGLIYVGCGVVAWRIVPRPIVGWLMVGTSILWSSGSWYPIARGAGALWPLLSGVTDAWAITVGALLLCYPTGRIYSRVDWGILVAGIVLFAVRFFGLLLFSSPSEASCGCAPNVYASLPSAGIDYVMGTVWRIGGVSLIIVIAIRLTIRWFTSTLPARRAAFIMPLALIVWAYAFVQEAIGYISGVPVAEPFQFIPPVAISAIPLSFIAGVFYIRGLRARVADLVIVARDRVDRALWETSLASSLRDSSLRVYWWDEPAEVFFTSRGEPLTQGIPPLRAGRSTLEIESEEGRVALIEHDVALSEDTRLLDAVSSALLLSVDNDRLRQKLERTLQEVRESRLRIVEESYLARRRVERDLHDGSQQLLVSLAIGLRIATTKARSAGNDEVVGDLERASVQLADALRELRELARGIHPTVLTAGDLRSALAELALRSHIPVEVEVELPERLPGVIEETIYFVVAECLTNAAKHAGAAACAVTVRRLSGPVSVVITDDGNGGAVLVPGGGLGGVRDRIETINGQFELSSGSGHGTRIELTIPVP